MISVHPLAGRKQSLEQIAKRVASVAATKALWTPERRELFCRSVSRNNPMRKEEARLKMAATKRGKPSPRRGMAAPWHAGENHPMFGKHHSSEANAKNAARHLGIKQSPELVAKRVDARSGYRHTEDVKRKIRETNNSTWSRPDVLRKVTGPNSASWLGGKSFEPYPTEWTKKLRDLIRQRDNHQCRVCKTSEHDNGKRLDVHHIDYDKSNLAPSNLASLCVGCHRKTNFNRPSWMAWFGVEKTYDTFS